MTCSTVLGAVFNFFTTGCIAFANDKWHCIFSFLLVYGIVLVVNLELLTLLVESGINKALAQAALMPCVVVPPFLLNNYPVFGRRS